MSLLSWLKGLRRRPEPPRARERALPEPKRVNLVDAQVETDFFVRLPEWSSYGPNRAAWELPDQAGQEARYQQLIQEHAERGGLDGLVPDLMDRLIHEEMDELRRRVDQAHEDAVGMLDYFHEQAKLAQTRLSFLVQDRRGRLAVAEQGYATAYEELTGEAVAVPDQQPVGIAPILTPTRVVPYQPQPLAREEAAVEPHRDEDDGPGEMPVPAQLRH